MSITTTRAAIMASEPTHLLTENGLVPLPKPPAPDENTWRFFEMDPHLVTGLEWIAMQTSVRMAIMVEWGFPADRVLSNNVLEILPEETLAYLAFWQHQINTGDCWRTSGAIGRQAASLVQSGHLLAGKERVKNYFGHPVGCRTDLTPGIPGSPAFVQALMGDEYLAWISAVA
jgi:hypothetical protein